MQIEIVASKLSYSDTEHRFPAHEVRDGVVIHRVRTTGFGRAGLIARAIDYLSFYLAATGKVLFLLRRGDVLVVKTDPPLLSVFLTPVARLRSAKLVNWLQDIYPELAEALGMRFSGGCFGKFLKALRNRSLHRASANVVLGERMYEHLVECGANEATTVIIPNFSDDQAIMPLPLGSTALRAEWGLSSEDLVVGYSGNLGRAHDVETIMRAARLLQEGGTTSVRFLFIGGGALFDTIGEASRRHGLTNVVVRPYQPRALLRESLAVPDLHLISLRDELEGYIFPSKYYGVLAAGRGIVFLGATGGDISSEIQREGLGVSFRIGDAQALAAYLSAARNNRPAIEKSGRLARALLEGKYLRNHCFDRWERLLRRVAGE